MQRLLMGQRGEGEEGDEGPAREVHSGSGYWSQDGTTQIVFPNEGARNIRVTWPGGETTIHPLDRPKEEVVLKIGGSTK